MGAAYSSETMVSIDKTARVSVSEDRNINVYHPENLKIVHGYICVVKKFGFETLIKQEILNIQEKNNSHINLITPLSRPVRFNLNHCTDFRDGTCRPTRHVRCVLKECIPANNAYFC